MEQLYALVRFIKPEFQSVLWNYVLGFIIANFREICSPVGSVFFYIVNIFFLFSLLLVIVLLENDMGYCYYFTCLSGISSHVGPAKPSLPAGRD